MYNNYKNHFSWYFLADGQVSNLRWKTKKLLNMHVYEVTSGIYKIFSWIAFLKTYSTGYFRKQQTETGYFCGMTLRFFNKTTTRSVTYSHTLNMEMVSHLK